MSTRSCIARQQGDGFEGVYHHWDGYPTGLGKTLWDLMQQRTIGDVKDTLRVLIDEHPAGWSTINEADWSQPPGFEENGFTTTGPECYCHGGRSEDPQPVTHADDGGIEWAYVFNEDARTMAVCERTYEEDGDHATGMFGTLGVANVLWTVRAIVPLDGPEPDWSTIECGQNLERCPHVEGYHEKRGVSAA